MRVDDQPHYRNKIRCIAGLFAMSENLLMTSARLDDESFDVRFDALLENPSVPQAPDGLFANMFRMLDEICSSIVGPRAQL